MARQAFDQRHDALAHQRLAAGQPQFLDALLNEGRADPVQFLDGQQFFFGRNVMSSAMQ